MIQTLAQAREYMFDRIQEISGEDVQTTEKEILTTLLYEEFYEKIWFIIGEEELESIQAEDEKELEWILFYKIPNYVSLLEECTAKILAEYLSPNIDTYED